MAAQPEESLLQSFGRTRTVSARATHINSNLQSILHGRIIKNDRRGEICKSRSIKKLCYSLIKMLLTENN